MMKNFYTLIVLCASVFLMAGCEKKDYENTEEMDKRLIGEYLRANNLTMTSRNDSIYYQIVKQGTGAAIKNSEMVPLIFTVRSLDGKYVAADTFAASNRFGASGQYAGYFSPAGLRVAAVELLKNRGGEIRVIIPSRYAYGRNGVGSIPGNASLDYTLKIINEKAGLPAYEDLSINKYLQANSLTGFTKTSSGMYYKILTAGTGSPITLDSTITVKYSGRLLNGSVFDQTSGDNTASFVLKDMIQGWKEAIPMIKGGGKMRLLIPSPLAYGLSGSISGGMVIIPTASALDFEVEVTDVDD
jgi:FKBP-type peptidyl-prolyl cis-trans isomerase FkpA